MRFLIKEGRTVTMTWTTVPLGLAITSVTLAGAADWTLNEQRVTAGPARYADVDGDGSGDVVFGTMGPIGNPFSSGRVYAFDVSGAALPGFPVTLGQPVVGAIAIADLDGDGDAEIVATSWQFAWVFNHDGSTAPGWPLGTGVSASIAPALGDLDDDGDLEIVVAAGTQLRAYHHDGAPVAGWPVIASESFQAPAIGDVDGDGAPEVVAGTWRPQFPDTVPFELHMVDASGASEPGFPIGGLGSVRGAVSLGDVDGDGGVEIVTRAGDTLHVFDAGGTIEPGWPVTPGGPIRNAETAIGDIDLDGDMEIVIGGFDLWAYHHDGGLVDGWPVDLPTNTANIKGSAVIADLDGDAATVEVMTKITNGFVAVDAGGSTLPGFPIPLSDDNQSSTFSPAPAVGDLDGDGTVEYLLLSHSGRFALHDETAAWTDEAARGRWPCTTSRTPASRQATRPSRPTLTVTATSTAPTSGSCSAPGGRRRRISTVMA
jgi:hypothetical protein